MTEWQSTPLQCITHYHMYYTDMIINQLDPYYEKRYVADNLYYVKYDLSLFQSGHEKGPCGNRSRNQN